MLTSSSRVSTTTLTGTLPGGGSSPWRYGRRPSLVILRSPSSQSKYASGVERRRVGRDPRCQRRLGRAQQRVRIADGVAAQRGAGDLPVLRRVPGDHRLPVHPRLGQRPAERLQARREVDGPAACPQPAQSR